MRQTTALPAKNLRLAPPRVWTSAAQLFTMGVGPLVDLLYGPLLFAFIFVTIFLPAGSFYGFNFKYPIYALLLPCAGFVIFYRGYLTRTYLALLLSIPALLAVWLGIGLLYGFDLSSVVRQFTDIFLMFLLCWLITLYSGTDAQRYLRLLRLIVTASVATALLKVGLIAYALARGIPVVQVVLWLNSAFGVELMTMDLGSLFGRIQFMADELIPICIFVVLRYRDQLRIGSIQAALTILLLTVSVILSFSRYFWAFAALAFVLGLLLGKRDRFQFVVIALLVVSIVASLPALAAVYELRFSTEVAGGSDIQRTEQIPPLQAFFFDAPVFGHGLGSFTPVLLRDDTVAGRYAYEVQLLALPGQIGMVGVGLLLALAGFYFRKLWWHCVLNTPDRIAIVALLLFWLSAGTTNPLLFHPVASINYAAIAAMAGIANRRGVTKRQMDGECSAA